MLETLNRASFEYRGQYITAQRMVNKVDNKFFGWHGIILGSPNDSVVAKTIQQFETQFKLLVDKLKDNPVAADEDTPRDEDWIDGSV